MLNTDFGKLQDDTTLNAKNITEISNKLEEMKAAVETLRKLVHSMSTEPTVTPVWGSESGE